MRHLTKVLAAGLLVAASAPAMAASVLPAGAGSLVATGSTATVQPLTDGLLSALPALPDILVVDGPIEPITALPPNYTIDIVELKPHGAAATAVPEPATWAMMMLGFAALGYVMRRRRSDAVRIRLI